MSLWLQCFSGSQKIQLLCCFCFYVQVYVCSPWKLVLVKLYSGRTFSMPPLGSVKSLTMVDVVEMRTDLLLRQSVSMNVLQMVITCAKSNPLHALWKLALIIAA